MTTWPITWDRGQFLAAIETASGEDLSANDATVDTLMAKAQEIGLSPIELRVWIYEGAPDREGFTPDALVNWAVRIGRCRP
jgi:hypothetical protein